MADPTTPAIPASQVNLTVSDPVSADIQAVCSAVSDVMKFLATPEGQETVKAWRAYDAQFNAAIQKAATWLQNLFTGKL